MAKVRTRVYLSNAAFRGLNYPNGPVGGFTNKVAATAFTIARRTAPRRTGAMRDTIFVRQARSGALGVHVNVVAGGPRAPHTQWVHDGTDGHLGYMILYYDYLLGSRSPQSWVGRMPTMGSVGNFANTVGHVVLWREGQTANPFLANAGHAAFVRHVH